MRRLFAWLHRRRLSIRMVARLEAYHKAVR